MSSVLSLRLVEFKAQVVVCQRLIFSFRSRIQYNGLTLHHCKMLKKIRYSTSLCLRCEPS